MKPKFIFFFILIVWVPWPSSAQHQDETLINQDVRRAWKDSAFSELKLFQPEMAEEHASFTEKYIENMRILSIRVQGNVFVPVGRRNWIYMFSVSSHDSPQTGDMTLAIDQQKRIYLNEGHVCGGIIHFETSKLRSIKRSRQFFRHFVSDVDQVAWIRIQ